MTVRCSVNTEHRTSGGRRRTAAGAVLRNDGDPAVGRLSQVGQDLLDRGLARHVELQALPTALVGTVSVAVSSRGARQPSSRRHHAHGQRRCTPVNTPGRGCVDLETGVLHGTGGSNSSASASAVASRNTFHGWPSGCEVVCTVLPVHLLRWLAVY
jgi:hypothetical protein